MKSWLLGASLLALAGCVVAPVPSGAPGSYPNHRAEMRQSAPPPDLLEHRGPPPAVGYFWIAGHWDWSGRRYEWQPGHWLAPQPGHVWQPHVWRQEGNGWRQDGGRWEESQR